jgi:hypothetical protein
LEAFMLSLKMSLGRCLELEIRDVAGPLSLFSKESESCYAVMNLELSTARLSLLSLMMNASSRQSAETVV